MEQRYEIVEQKGKKLFKAKSKGNDKAVILKKIPFSSLSPKKKEHIVNEVNTLIRMEYIHILRYLDYEINKKDITVDIVMEYCEGGSLQDLIAKSKAEGKKISQDQIWRIFYQLAQAIQYIHSDSIIHRNINPSNVYFAEVQRKNLKLGGFNLSKRLDFQEDFSSTVLPNTYYLSPQQIETGICTKQTDVWAIGCLIYELCALQPAFKSANEFQRVKMIKEVRPKKLPYSIELNRVVFWCLQKSAQDRPTLSDLTKTPEISLRIRERRYQAKYSEYLSKQQRLVRRQKQLQRQQQLLRQKSLRVSYQSIKKRKGGQILTSRKPIFSEVQMNKNMY